VTPKRDLTTYSQSQVEQPQAQAPTQMPKRGSRNGTYKRGSPVQATLTDGAPAGRSGTPRYP